VEAGVERKKQTGFEDDAVVVASHEISVDVPVAVCGSLAAGLILNGKIVRGVFFFFLAVPGSVVLWVHGIYRTVLLCRRVLGIPV
jgi:hypothetical protein